MKTTSTGIYLTAAEQKEVQELADQAGYSKHAFLQYGLRWFVSEYKKDPGILKTEEKTVLSKPD